MSKQETLDVLEFVTNPMTELIIYTILNGFLLLIFVNMSIFRTLVI